jgi:hypothetical protein
MYLRNVFLSQRNVLLLGGDKRWDGTFLVEGVVFIKQEFKLRQKVYSYFCINYSLTFILLFCLLL